MIYFIALVWDARNEEHAMRSAELVQRFVASSPNWSVTHMRDGFFVACSDESPHRLHKAYPLTGARGVVFGKLFETSYCARSDTHETPPNDVTFDESRSVRLVATGGKALIRDYWGEYVAFLRDPQNSTSWVVRDPTGRVPCQHAEIEGMDAYFVRLEDFDRLAPMRLSINAHYLLGYLTFDSVCVRETGLREIDTLLPGECIERRGQQVFRTFYWDARKISQESVIEDPTEAALLMRKTVRACTHAWASCFDSILLNLSGGLDSSIVCSQLSSAPTSPSIVCSNFHSSDPGSDERAYARAAAERANFELLERPVNTKYSIDLLADVPRVPFPFPWWASDREAGREEIRFLRSRGIQVQFTGHGGDELFYNHSALPSAVDYAWRRGPRRSLLEIALDDALIHETSLWRVLRVAYHYGLRKRPWTVAKIVSRAARVLMTAEALERAHSDLSLWHPLYRDEADIEPCKYSHSYLLTFGATNVYIPSPHEFTIDQVSPLRSQPFIELSLRTPSYVLRSGGQDRSLARRAFADDLPPQIVRRKTKAYANAQVQRILDANLGFVRELLLDGYLVSEGLLNREKLQRVLSKNLTEISAEVSEITTYLSVEGWVRSWASHRHCAAA